MDEGSLMAEASITIEKLADCPVLADVTMVCCLACGDTQPA